MGPACCLWEEAAAVRAGPRVSSIAGGASTVLPRVG